MRSRFKNWEDGLDTNTLCTSDLLGYAKDSIGCGFIWQRETMIMGAISSGYIGDTLKNIIIGE